MKRLKLQCLEYVYIGGDLNVLQYVVKYEIIKTHSRKCYDIAKFQCRSAIFFYNIVQWKFAPSVDRYCQFCSRKSLLHFSEIYFQTY